MSAPDADISAVKEEEQAVEFKRVGWPTRVRCSLSRASQSGVSRMRLKNVKIIRALDGTPFTGRLSVRCLTEDGQGARASPPVRGQGTLRITESSRPHRVLSGYDVCIADAGQVGS